MRMKGKKAQTSLELAIFGSILIFVLGSIIRTAVISGNQQHSLLRSTRMAMSTSHKSSESKKTASRNFASVLVLEDRLAADSGKYGAIDRIPFISQGTAVHSPNLFMPVDFGDSEDLPIMDVYVNGKQFGLRGSNFRTVQLARKCAGAAPCHADCKGDCSLTSAQYYRGEHVKDGDAHWEPACIDEIVTPPPTCPAGEGTCDCSVSPCECSISGNACTYPPPIHVITGCAKLYTIIDNHPLISQWCDDGTGTEARPCPNDNLSADERFDLDRDDLDGIPGDTVVPAADRESFSWQWFLVLGAEDGQNSYAEGIIFPDDKGGTPKNEILDVDGDLKEEIIVVDASAVGDYGVILSLGVNDYQAGDMDFTYNDRDKARGDRPPGFTKDVRMYVFIHDAGPDGGTYLQIDEGALFLPSLGDDRQFIRTASKKDQVDIIERIFQLSNNTGAFCSSTGVRKATANGISNPVEVCGATSGACFLSANITRTCMDVDSNLIFVRSRIKDLHGRKWVTDVSSDAYVDFVIE